MKKYLPFFLIIVIFLVLRFSTFGQMYHQDEYKWAMIVDPAFHQNLKSDHPPLVGILYKATGAIFGYDHLRILPIFSGLFCLILLFFLVRKFYGEREAMFTSIIYTLSTYALIAGTQIDIDGALLPAVSLLTFYAYLSLLRGHHKNLWLPILIITFVLGFLIKLSFIIVIGTIATDYLLKHKINRELFKKVSKYLLLCIVSLVILTLVFVFLFRITNPFQFLINVTHFGILNFVDRNYSQLFFLTVKSLILASPLVLLPFLLVFSKRYLNDLRLWFIYLAYNIVFYYIIFDFTNRTIERYDMFIIVPSAMIGGIFLAEKIRNRLRGKKDALIAICIVLFASFTAFALASIKSIPLPLNPKSVYIDKLKNLDFNFLIPITGGSGPIGFYVSVTFAIFLFILCLLLLVWYWKVERHRYAPFILVAFISLAFSYNFVLSQELIAGTKYGSVDRVAKVLALEVAHNQNVKQIITYNDVAGYELNVAGKYYKRFYTDPIFKDTNISKFTDYNGYYMVVNFPLINKDSVYWKYLLSCKNVYQVDDAEISGYIFDCSKGNQTLLN